MNENNIAIIVHKNNEVEFTNLMNSLNTLVAPKGFEVNVIVVGGGGVSKYKQYNHIIDNIDAKYKIYLSESIEIINKYLLIELLEIFKSNKDIGIIGCSGAAELPSNGITLQSDKRYGSIYIDDTQNLIRWNEIQGKYQEVEAVDEFLLATQYDLYWHDELFNGDDMFGVTAQCLEFKRKGYQSVVAYQETPWICSKKNNFIIIEQNQVNFLRQYSRSNKIHDESILLSICIPTYNRAELVYKLVLDCLKIDSNRIEVIVSDNHSTDDTKVLLSQIKDKRFIYHRNSENTGADNIGSVLLKSNGKFCLLLRDKDSLPEIEKWFFQVEPYLDNSANTDIFRGSLFDPDHKILTPLPIRIFKKDTLDAYLNVINGSTYATSIIFPRKTVFDIYDKAKTSAPYFWSIYPHISLLLFCTKYGDCIPMSSLTVKMRATKVYFDVKSLKGSLKLDEPYWTPLSRKQQHLDFIKTFRYMELSPEVKIQLLLSMIDRYCNWFNGSFRAVHENSYFLNLRSDVLERYRNKSISEWHAMFWDGYISMAREIASLYDISVIDINTINIALKWYQQFLNLTAIKERGELNL